MDTIYEFGNEIFINASTINKISREFFKIVKKELPKKALNYECVDFIIEEIRTQMKNKEINL